MTNPANWTAFKQAVLTPGAWTRRRFLVNCFGLCCGALLPWRKAAAQTTLDASHAATLQILVGGLLPQDEFSPSAAALGVHLQIISDARQDPALAILISDGCRWLNQSFGALSALDAAQIERLLQAMSEADWDVGPRIFYHQLRDRTMMYYYADPRAWNGLSVHRPPQPLGYPESSES